MEKIIYDGEFFSVQDTLECGQCFRFTPYKKGYFVITKDKACYAYNEDNTAVIECEEASAEYFKYYFDLETNYKTVNDSAKAENADILSIAAESGKGIRMLRQDSEEMLFSFIVSQNNHIPRIKAIINRLSESLGEKKEFDGVTYHAFPKAEKLAEHNAEFYASLGLGYRDEYISRVAKSVVGGFNLTALESLPTVKLKKELMSLHGVGAKVADCVALFGFNRRDSFPVDTWIEKLYKEDFKGELTDRQKISEYFTGRFKASSGIYQQYLFYYKRSNEKKQKAL